MGKKVIWKGVFPAICMPLLEDYSIDELSLRKYVSWMSGVKGLGGLVVNGHASEVTTFSREERRRIVEVTVDEVGDRIPIISGINCEGTIEAIRHAQDAVKAGASAVMIQPSHMWLRSGVETKTAVQYIRDVAEAVKDTDIAIQVYPKNCRATYSIDALVQMANIPNVKVMKLGIRDCATYEKAIRVLRQEAPDVALFTCYDEALLSSMMQPIDGALVGVAGCIPELVVEAWNAVQSGDWNHIRDCGRRLDVIANAVYGIAEISGEAHARAKELLHMRGGIPSGLARRPVLPLTQTEKDNIAKAIVDSGVPKINL